MDVEQIRAYLALGCVPDTERASAYLRRLLPPDVAPPAAPVDVLVQLVADGIGDAGAVTLPLSGGNDSRGLLGAALRVLRADQIRCVSVGTADYADVVVAERTCRRLGIHHTRIAPDDIEWDLDELVAIARARWESDGVVVPLDTIVMFEAIARSVPAEVPVLSGYLGDAVSGKHLPLQPRRREAPAGAVRAFLDANRAMLSPSAWRPHLRRFVDDHRHLLDGRPGATAFDLLDLGFRQALRIRPGVVGSFPLAVCPYEDPAWIAHWTARPVEERLGQRAYRRLYREAFPEIFTEPVPEDPPRRSPGQFVPLRLKQELVRRFVKPSAFQMANRGDPRRNTSMAALLRTTTAAFDQRGVVPVSTAAEAESLLRAPTSPAWMNARWGATAEIALRATS